MDYVSVPMEILEITVPADGCTSCVFNRGGCTAPRKTTPPDYESNPVPLDSVRGGKWCKHITLDELRALFSKN